MHFFHPIQQSTRHIYHSALPLPPESSIFFSMSLPETTRIGEFHGRPGSWGSVLRTITNAYGGFTCVTAFDHRSAARISTACEDGAVGIYDSVTGVLRLSLRPLHPVQAMSNSPDGSILFCTHRENPSITLWDIQTGGLVLTFTLTAEAKDAAVSVGGRCLACGLSDGTVIVRKVANRMASPPFGNGSPVTCLCWLAPEERLMVASGASVYIRETITGDVLVRGFNI